MKILWATDFTRRARDAGQVAGELARLTGGTVEAVHILAPRTTELLALGADAALMDEEGARSAEAQLAGEARALEERGTKAGAWLGQGDVAATLLARAVEMGADVIVMGGKGRSAVGQLVLGSGADRILRQAVVPVLVVPDGVTTLQPSGGPLRVLAALDGPEAERGGARRSGGAASGPDPPGRGGARDHHPRHGHRRRQGGDRLGPGRRTPLGGRAGDRGARSSAGAAGAGRRGVRRHASSRRPARAGGPLAAGRVIASARDR